MPRVCSFFFFEIIQTIGTWQTAGTKKILSVSFNLLKANQKLSFVNYATEISLELSIMDT